MSTRNLYTPSVYGVGYIGERGYKTKSKGRHNRYYIAWHNMIMRCYKKDFDKIRPTYANCSVDEKWHNFQVFAEWFEKNYVEGYVLDKDILVKGNKIYSPEMCCFVPQEINAFYTKRQNKRRKYLIGVSWDKEFKKFLAQINIEGKVKKLGRYKVEIEAFQTYKEAKESEAKRLAVKYKYQITKRTYQALINYKVEITD